MLQFGKLANLYFLILSVMELYKPISDSNGQPVLAAPLFLVIGLSMIKDAYEDYQRHKQDSDENNRKALVGTTFKKKKKQMQEFIAKRW
jgi:hypothetical protein